jgi:hypothetical protein
LRLWPGPLADAFSSTQTSLFARGCARPLRRDKFPQALARTKRRPLKPGIDGTLDRISGVLVREPDAWPHVHRLGEATVPIKAPVLGESQKTAFCPGSETACAAIRDPPRHVKEARSSTRGNPPRSDLRFVWETWLDRLFGAGPSNYHVCEVRAGALLIFANGSTVGISKVSVDTARDRLSNGAGISITNPSVVRFKASASDATCAVARFAPAERPSRAPHCFKVFHNVALRASCGHKKKTVGWFQCGGPGQGRSRTSCGQARRSGRAGPSLQ